MFSTPIVFVAFLLLSCCVGMRSAKTLVKCRLRLTYEHVGGSVFSLFFFLVLHLGSPSLHLSILLLPLHRPLQDWADTSSLHKDGQEITRLRSLFRYPFLSSSAASALILRPFS